MVPVNGQPPYYDSDKNVAYTVESKHSNTIVLQFIISQKNNFVRIFSNYDTIYSEKN